MSKQRVAQTPAKEKQKPAALTLADLTLTWNDGVKDQEASPEQIALALEYAWRMLGDGCGDFNLFRDASEASNRLQAAEDFVQAIAHTQENGDDVELETLWILRDLIRDGRVRSEMNRHARKPEAYQVNLEQPAPAAAGGQR